MDKIELVFDKLGELKSTSYIVMIEKPNGFVGIIKHNFTKLTNCIKTILN